MSMRILTVIGLSACLATAHAQTVRIAEESTPAIGEVYSFAWSSSGNAYSLTDLPLYEVYLNLPFGLDFNAGHSVVYGQAMNGTEFVGNVFGYSLYAQKQIGGDGAFLRGSAFVVIGETRKPDYGLALGLGWRF